MAISENSDRAYDKCRHMTKTYAEMRTAKPKPKDTRTGEEIAADIIKRITKEG